MMTKGFYKNDDGMVLHGPTMVSNTNYVLNDDLKDTYTYPVDGWYWFDSVEEAYLFFGLELPIEEPTGE